MPPPPPSPDPSPEERLRADLPDDVPGLERLAELPGIVPPDERPVPGPGEPGFEAVFGDAAPRRLGARELLLAALVFLLLAAVPLRQGLFDPEQVQFGLDQARLAEPWATAVGEREQLNAGLSDQAVNFYPFYRWVARSWLAGDAPTWNPLIYCGAPGLGNPQAGVLDPQVGALVLLEALFGLDGFHWGLAATAWLRLGLAALGAYALARRLGLGARGAGLAGLGFGFSGYLVLWLNFPLGHVPPFLPWILFFVEGLATPGPGELSPWPRRRAFVGAALCMLGAVLGGHPETSFFVGVTAGLWSLGLWARDRRGGLLALGALALGSALSAVVLVPFVRYLQRSGAHAVRSTASAEVAVDLVALGLLLLVGALLWAVLRAIAVAGAEVAGDVEPGARGLAPGSRRWVGLGSLHAALVVLVGGGLLVLFGRGLEERFFLTFLHDLWGRPGVGDGYFGPGSSLLESASTYLVGVVLATALAAVAQRAPGGAPGARGLARFGTVLALAGVSLGLALGTPGLVDLYRLVPLVGLGDTVRFAAVSSLMVSLLAGEGLEHARGGARASAVLMVLTCAGLAVLADRTPPDPLAGQPNAAPGAAVQAEVEGLGELFGLTHRPGLRLAPRLEQLDGWVHPDLDVGDLRLTVQRLRPAGVAPPGGDSVDAFVLPLVLGGGPGQVAAPAAAPAGARTFRAAHFQTGRLEEGWWGLTLELFAPGASVPFARRDLGRHLVERDLAWSPWTLGLFGAGLLVLVLPLRRRVELLLVLATLQALAFAEGQNPAYPAAEVFPPTATERILAEGLGFHRFLSGPASLPPDTGLVRGLRALDGYDALDPAAFNELRPLAMRPGVHPLLGWNALGVDLASPVFRMLGVSMLVSAEPLDAARLAAAPGDWQLVARPPVPGEPPRPADLEAAETWIYRDRAPFPRAWCVTEAALPEDVRADLAAWDPERTAILLEPWAPAAPAVGRVLAEPTWTNSTVTLELEVTAASGTPDATCLLVLSEQSFPGTWFEVDGERRPALEVNGAFVGCELRVGDRRVVLRRP